MAKKINWSPRADKDRQKILEYWIKRNKSNTYSLKLDEQFREIIILLAKEPELGLTSHFPFIRYVIVGTYLIYYRIKEDRIEIVRIWDNRRNPAKFKL